MIYWQDQSTATSSHRIEKRAAPFQDEGIGKDGMTNSSTPKKKILASHPQADFIPLDISPIAKRVPHQSESEIDASEENIMEITIILMMKSLKKILVSIGLSSTQVGTLRTLHTKNLISTRRFHQGTRTAMMSLLMRWKLKLVM